MSGMDYGYIPICNKKVRFLSKYSSGAGCPYGIGNLQFYKYHAEKIYVMSESDDKIIIDFEKELDFTGKVVVYWEYQTIKYKTKRIGKGLYLTKFKHRGCFKKLIHGYDVDMVYCHNSKRLFDIRKIIKKLCI